MWEGSGEYLSHRRRKPETFMTLANDARVRTVPVLSRAPIVAHETCGARGRTAAKHAAVEKATKLSPDGLRFASVERIPLDTVTSFSQGGLRQLFCILRIGGIQLHVAVGIV